MKNSAQIRLLEAQIDKIDDLEKGENYDNYKSWHTQTELLLKDILEVHEKAIEQKKIDFIDSASIMKYYGHNLNIINGPSENIKITTPSDFYIFKAILDMKENLNIFGL